MAKIIKKKLINSLPIFLILSLLSMSVIGLVFNFDIEVRKIGNKVGLSVELPEVEAQITDTATTSVRIKNSAPTFTTSPAESPVSASTTPINVGGSITFTGTASDNEGNDFYLIICDQDGVTPGAGGIAPLCDNTTFCVSASTTPDTQASCTYTGVVDPGAETEDWVGYACDTHTIEPECTAVSDNGSGDTGSPFYVNHAPSFSGVATIVDDQLPGGTFTFQATTTDLDTEGGADVLTLDVCRTNSWDLFTGCDVGEDLCTGTSTSPNVTCDWTTGVPLDDALSPYSYYAFVKDWHDMQSTEAFQSSDYTVTNATPSVSSITLNNGSDIILNIKGAPNVTVYASTTSITDDNGCEDILSATGTIYLSSVSDGMNCDQDDNDCYPMTGATCIIDESTCTGPTDSDVTVRCSADLAYYAIPTVEGDVNPYGVDEWLASIKAFDEIASYATTSSGVELTVSTAIEVNELDVAYGALVGGTDTGTDNATTTIVNAGNSPLDTNVIGDDLLLNSTGPEYIAASWQEYDLLNFIYGAGTVISSSTDTLIDTEIRRPTSITEVEDSVYWGIYVPNIISGDYYGLNTFTAALDVDVNTEW